jgi:hypothetical protein
VEAHHGQEAAQTLIVCAACHDWIHANPATRAA